MTFASTKWALLCFFMSFIMKVWGHESTIENLPGKTPRIRRGNTDWSESRGSKRRVGKQHKRKEEESKDEIDVIPSDHIFDREFGIQFPFLPPTGNNEDSSVAEIFDMDDITPEFNLGDRNRRYIISLTDFIPITNIIELATQIAKSFGAVPDHVYTNAIRGFSVYLPDIQYEFLMGNTFWTSFIDRIEEDQKIYAFQNFPSFSVPPVEFSEDGQRLYAQSIVEFPPLGIMRINGNNPKLKEGNENVNIAIFDTGVDEDHPDLNVANCKSFVLTESCNDVHGHGTHVAGVIGGARTGVAPGAGIWGMKTLAKDGSGFTADLVRALDYVLENKDKVHIVNLSLGGAGLRTSCSEKCNCGSSFHTAVCKCVEAGIVVIVAAGNSGVNSRNSVPANFKESFTVSAYVDTDGKTGGAGNTTKWGDDDTFASFSNYGIPVDIAAPGVNILSTSIDGGYRKLSGTSMACPHVSGAAALYIARHGLTRTKDGVKAVTGALLSMASSQSGTFGFTGDRDNDPEPLLNLAHMASDIYGAATLVSVTMDVESGEYGPDDDHATIIVTVSDETGSPVSQLSSDAFHATLLQGGKHVSGTHVGNFVEKVAGTYEAIMILTSLETDVQHTVGIEVTNESVMGSDASNFIVRSDGMSIVVHTIEYKLASDDSGAKIVIDLTCSPKVEGAEVAVSLYRNARRLGGAVARTRATGAVRFFLRSPLAGEYTTVVEDIVFDGRLFRDTYYDVGHKVE